MTMFMWPIIVFLGDLSSKCWLIVIGLVPLDYQREGSSHLVPEVIYFGLISLQQIRIKRFVDKFELINQMRSLGGVLQYPRQQEVDPALMDEIIFGKKQTRPKTIEEKHRHLSLVGGPGC
jgi:hypothetical protein